MSKSAELKDLKEPDKFQVVAGEAASWLAARRRKAALVAGAVAVVIVVAGGAMAMGERKTSRAGALLAEVYRTAGAEISPVPLPGVPGPFYPSDAARQKAVIEAADRVLVEASGTRPAALAAVAKGDASLRLREWDQALAAYQLYLAAAGPKDSLRFGALEGLAMAEEGKGNTEGALAAYGRLGSEVPAMSDRADLERARLLAATGKTDEARKILTGFAEAHKDSTLTAQATERLGKLGGK